MNWLNRIKSAAELIEINRQLLFKNKEREKYAVELIKANKELAFQNEAKELRAAELIIANIELAFQNGEKEKRAAELILANIELVIQHKEKEKQAAELVIANKKLLIQHEEKEKRAAELILANIELVIQHKEKEKQAAELVIANKKLVIQHEEKEKHAAELGIANKELAFQNDEKEKRAEELGVANKELAFQNNEKEKRAAELGIANKELAFQNDEKEKRAAELGIANKELAFQNDEKEKRAEELGVANKELAFQNNEKEKRAAELIIANKELNFQNKEREKRATELTIANILKEQAEKSKNAVEEKNKSITDSINYAKRIQQAKLPKKDEIYASLNQCFVLFKPKDIVSGDFYFFHKNEKSLFIVAADCTGHGVPGAFMSMIGSEKLDDAVAHSSNTSEILNHLNRGIKHSLHQSNSDDSTRDGMDIAICSIDTKNCIVNYAGANRPFWLIRKGKSEIEEIKGTKKAIGGLTENNQHFDTHELNLQKGDTFYISTDGYADQFGGQTGKKLMTKKFKEILLDIQYKTMPEQESHLDDFFENWKEDAEQVDDILVIGVRM